jgi:valyl-tRNA synthetase
LTNYQKIIQYFLSKVKYDQKTLFTINILSVIRFAVFDKLPKKKFNRQIMTSHSNQFLNSPSFWILAKYYQLEKDLESSNSNYELAHSIDSIYKFLWDDYADWYVEYLKTTNPVEIDFAKQLFRQFIITVSPFCPFETEAIWSQFFGESTNLVKTIKDSTWSQKALELYFEVKNFDTLDKNSAYLEFQKVIQFVNNIRSLRGLFAIDPVISITVNTDVNFLYIYKQFLKLICKVELSPATTNQLYNIKENDYEYQVDIIQYIKDINQELVKTNKQIDSINKQIDGLNKQLLNSSFVQNAEPEIIQEKKQQLIQRQIELEQQQAKLVFLKG